MAGNFERKKKSYGNAKMKPAVEFQRELLIWVLNAIHMARLRGNDVALPTIAIERLLRVDSLQRAEAAYPYIEEVIRPSRCHVELLKPTLKKTSDDSFMILKVRVSNILKSRITRLEKRYRREVKLREKFEGTARTRPKMATDIRPQF